jgi:hypothetical protein
MANHQTATIGKKKARRLLSVPLTDSLAHSISMQAVLLIVLSVFLASCASLSKGKTEFERFSFSFSQEASKAEQSINKYSEFVKKLSDYEKRVGNLSDADYVDISETLTDIHEYKNKMDLQIQKAKNTSRSVTPDGYYKDTGKKVRGWDNVVYLDMHIEAKLNALDQASMEAGKNYNAIDLNLLGKPDKPFNADAARLIRLAKSEIAAAVSDVSAKDWTSGKSSVDRANNAIKDALKLELNTIEQYQISLTQNDLRKVSSDISLGSTLNKAGAIIENAVEGATGILGGIGDILKGIGNQLNN